MQSSPSGPFFLNAFFIKPHKSHHAAGISCSYYTAKVPGSLASHITGAGLYDGFQFCTVTRVSHHELLNQCFVVIHNFLSIIHANVRVVYLIVLLTIKSNFLKILKDRKFNQHNYFSDAMLLSILNLLNGSLIYVPF